MLFILASNINAFLKDFKIQDMGGGQEEIFQISNKGLVKKSLINFCSVDFSATYESTIEVLHLFQ